jgi:hypothetical protein
MEGNYHGHRWTRSETWVLKESMKLKLLIPERMILKRIF